jgi:hypothetical protein
MIFCAVCFGDPTSPMTTGLNYGIMTLLAVLGVVLFCFAGMFLNIRRRSKNHNLSHS